MDSENKIKLYGFGVVGRGFHKYLVNNNEANRLHTVIVKDETKQREKISAIIETTNSKTVKDKDMYAILELINSAEEAYGIVSENLEIGKSVISSNKKMIADNLDELIQIEQSNTSNFLYEGAVCGSIPILRILNDLYTNEPIHEVKGIFNGSSNYILSQLFNDNVSYQEALVQAQDLGFAESDPTSDVGGFDALYKLVIVAVHAFGKIIKPEEVLNIGIQSVTKSDIVFAKKNGLKIKSVAKIELVGDNLSLTVLPTLIGEDSDLFNVENEYNAVSIYSKNIGKQFYKGKGAGSLPTGSVVYSDLKGIDSGYSYSYKKMNDYNYEFTNDKEEAFVLNIKDVKKLKGLSINVDPLYSLSDQRVVVNLSLEELKRNKLAIENRNISLLSIEKDFMKNIIAN